MRTRSDLARGAPDNLSTKNAPNPFRIGSMKARIGESGRKGKL
jgi:hypothetical protein